MLDRRSFVIGSMAAALSSRIAAAGDSSAVVQLRAGKVRGQLHDGVATFKGIPYGESTGGEMRFLPPRPRRSWVGIREAFEWGPRCPQATPLSPEESEGEDCLVANVYAPLPLTKRPRPVMVWFHGGGFASGSGGPHSRFEGLARDQDVIVVTLNHRLNVFGFLDLSYIDSRYSLSGNCGLLDLVLALQWVRDNASAFGGDRSRVTIFGHSGGGAKVSHTLALPSAQGLFQRAIAQSGAVISALDREQSRHISELLIDQLQARDNTIPTLQSVPSKTLLQAMLAIGSTGNPMWTTPNFSPVVDGITVLHQPGRPEALSISKDVPLMVGSTSQETRPFYYEVAKVPSMSLPDAVKALSRFGHTDEANAKHLLDGFAKIHPNMTPGELFTDVMSQYMFGHSSWLVAEARAPLAPTWLYRIEWTRPEATGGFAGAIHGVELSVLADEQADPPEPDMAANVEHARKMFRSVWGSFARNGDPATDGLPHWPRYDTVGRQAMVFDVVPHLDKIPSAALEAISADLPDFHP